jgi:hypothetical protein
MSARDDDEVVALPGSQPATIQTSSVLHHKAAAGELLWIKAALDAGADLHDQGGLYGRTLLHVAVRAPCFARVPPRPTQLSNPPALQAADNRLALARLLLERGADPGLACVVRPRVALPPPSSSG